MLLHSAHVLLHGHRQSQTTDIDGRSALVHGHFPIYGSIVHGESSFRNRGKPETHSVINWEPGNDEWVLHEKVDGSQLSFGMMPGGGVDGARVAMYNRTSFVTNSVIFSSARRSLEMLAESERLNPLLITHSEFVARPQHTRVVYERVPRFFVMPFDVQEVESKRWYSEEELELHCATYGMEPVQLLWDNKRCIGTAAFLVTSENSTNGRVDDPLAFATLVIRAMEDGRIRSKLGGKPEGCILKKRSYRNSKGQISCRKLKFVTPEYEEERSQKKPVAPMMCVSEELRWIGSHFDVPARFRKAYQRLRDAGFTIEAADEQVKDNLDVDLSKEQRAEILCYLQGDFWTRCRRACLAANQHKNQRDVDIEDIDFARVSALPDDGASQLWTTFQIDIASHARASLKQWREHPETETWLGNLFATPRDVARSSI